MLALRCSLAPDLQGSRLLYEVEFFGNPAADIPLGAYTDGPLRLSVPIGVVRQDAEQLSLANLKGGPHSYVRTFARHHYYHVVEKQGGSFTIPSLPGVQATVHARIMGLADSGVVALSSKVAGERDLVLLG